MIYLAFFVIFLIGLFTLLPSFNLILYGDTWLAFFRYLQHLGPKSSGEYNYLSYLLTPYGAQEILAGLMRQIFGYESTPYFLTSYILRTFSAFSFFPLIYQLTKSKLASLLAIIFFSITVVGFDTTDWVYNMTSYITIALFNLSLYFSIKSRGELKPFYLIFSGLLYYFAYIIAPVRMHGSLPLIFLLEVFWVMQNKNLKVFKRACIQFAVYLVIFLIIRYTGQSQGPPQEAAERLSSGIQITFSLLSQGRFDFLFYPVVMFGSIIIPDFLLPSMEIISKTDLFFDILLPTFLAFLVSSFFLIKNIPFLRAGYFKYILIVSSIWSILVTIVNQANLDTFFYSRYILLLLIGGYFLIFTILLIIKFFKQINISTGLFLGLTWSFLSFFFAWWWTPTSIFPTSFRYLIVSAQGISILLATIVATGKERKKQIYIFTFFCLLIVVHIIATRTYLNYLLNFHGKELSDKIWSQIPRISDIGKTKIATMFYFEGDPGTEGTMHDVITFGFPPHMALLYNLREENGNFPISTANWQEVVKAIQDDKIQPMYGQPVSTSIERVYAYHLVKNGQLIDISTLARKKLKQITSQNEAK